MQPFTFLSALPALLGLAGFVLFQVLGAHKSGDVISGRIIDRLRSKLPGEIQQDPRLTPKQVEGLLKQRQQYRQLVGEQDFLLLRQALTQQFVLNVLVHVLLIGFCSWSIYLFVKPLKVSQEKIAPAATEHAPSSQTSRGKNSPNVFSSADGGVTVTIQDQATPVTLDTAKPKTR